MNRWSLLGALLFGALFAFFAYWRIAILDNKTIKIVISAFLFGTYCAIVIFGTSDKKRSLSISAQTVLGVLFALTIATLYKADSTGVITAAVLGLVLGFTADYWVKYIQLP